MAWVASPWSPSSLQLRFGQRSAKPSPVLFKIRFRPSTRRILLASANGGDGQSWGSGDQSQDSFAGWSGSDCGDRDGGDPKKNEDRFGGKKHQLGCDSCSLFFFLGNNYYSFWLSYYVIFWLDGANWMVVVYVSNKGIMWALIVEICEKLPSYMLNMNL